MDQFWDWNVQGLNHQMKRQTQWRREIKMSFGEGTLIISGSHVSQQECFNSCLF